MALKCKLRLCLLLTLVLFAVGAMIAGEAFAADWFNEDWHYRKMITVQDNQVANGPHSNFTILVSIIDTDLRDKCNQSDCGDIVFTASNGTTTLNWERESYNNSTGALVAWVLIPSLDDDSGTRTEIYMYYGDTGNNGEQSTTDGSAWNNNYLAVWHLKENPDTTCSGTKEVCDSTSNGYHGDDEGSMDLNDQVTGQVDGSLVFDGVDDSINFGDVLDFDVGDEFSMCLWFNEISTGRSLLTKGQGGDLGYNGYVLDTGGSSGKVRFTLKFRLHIMGCIQLMLYSSYYKRLRLLSRLNGKKHSHLLQRSTLCWRTQCRL